jgi:hypothetical protein
MIGARKVQNGVAEQDEIFFVLSDEFPDQRIISSLLNGARSHPLPELRLCRPKGLPTFAYDHRGSFLLFVFCFWFTIHDLNLFELQLDFSHGIRTPERKTKGDSLQYPEGKPRARRLEFQQCSKRRGLSHTTSNPFFSFSARATISRLISSVRRLMPSFTKMFRK